MSSIRLKALAMALTLVCTAGKAAPAAQPETLASGQVIFANLDTTTPKMPDGSPYACYALHTMAGDRVSVSLNSSAFDPALIIARGALCSASALQFENDNFETGNLNAHIEFTAAGGRYLILARSTRADAVGSYSLSVQGGQTVFDEASTASSDKELERQRIMEREVAKRKQQLAAIEAKRLLQQAEEARNNAAIAAWEAEEERRWAAEETNDFNGAAEKQPTQNMMAGILNGLASGWNEETQKQTAMAAQFDETRQMIAQLKAEEAARQEREARAAQIDAAARKAQFRLQQANETARRAQANAEAAAQRSREIELASSSAAQASPKTSSFTNTATAQAAKSSAASTDTDANRCVTAPEVRLNAAFEGNTSASVMNGCGQLVDIRICLKRTGGWNCGVAPGVAPQERGVHSSFHATGEVFVDAKIKGSPRRFADPAN
ncbi:hypothetical protein [Arsukibacterium sp.]|uniref:hypothetical protein n=1 Tax=Arsukibacterium sp. TaxID=1977258 RepID=UPI00299D1C33|nr:hypothetical protein [Arsukibacterium sp.]MDX1537112.1 hypothetical protein [Arsukibacterium sp.]